MISPKAPKKWRVPADASPEAIEAADYAFERIIDVCAGRVKAGKAPSTLKAAIVIREEVCGPVVKKVEADVHLKLENLLAASMQKATDVTGPGVTDDPGPGPTDED